MRIPRYWKKGEFKGVGPQGKPITYVAWGWSDESLEQAVEKGNKRAYRAFRNHNRSKPSQDYEYLDIPLRESVEDVLFYEERETARITRNRYGALVLNAARVLFVDIDLQRPRTKGIIDWIRFQFSKSYRDQKYKEGEDQVLNSVIEWSLQNPYRSFRFYRTKAGFRMLFTDKLYDPESEEVAGLFEEFKSDPLYRTLTKRQNCFRARLTPKPWRIGMDRPLYHYPFAEDTHSTNFATWLSQYNERRRQCSICFLIRNFGMEVLGSSEISEIVRLHDSYCCRGNLPLA